MLARFSYVVHTVDYITAPTNDDDNALSWKPQ